MTRLLSLFGLMRVSEHERLTDERDNDAYASWNKAITDRDDMRMQRDDWQQKHNSVVGKLNQAALAIEKQAGEIADYRQALARAENMMDQASERLAEIREERDSLRPDALAMRRKRQMDRNRRKGNG